MKYLVKPENECYFYTNGEIMKKGTFAQESIISGVKSPFCLKKREGNIHIICVDNSNSLVYIGKKSHILCRLKPEFEVKRMRIVGKLMGFLCSAKYGNEILLIHCILGDRAQPSVIGRMANEYFLADDECVYYTDNRGVLGFCEFGDGKPDRFVKVAENAFFPNMYGDDIVYKKSGKIHINHVPKIDAPDAGEMVICAYRGYDVLAWESMRSLKYIRIDLTGEIKEIRSTGIPELLCVSDGNGEYYTYSPFLEDLQKREDSRQNIKTELERLRSDLERVENKLFNLNRKDL